ncbi:SRPBCC family protein [Paractinoplanes globisporus]|uniref:SRPBCC family protein n=1 Tax=Paractinoplanes globisporus TaxID=113565 RepID=A0ABW6WP25_9ACTN|nr:SRPBCC family protein [Actinoplanes globisporus]
MTEGTAKVTLPSDTQILITREFDAPRHHVWRAYTEPDLIKRWWAGKKGTVTSVVVDLRVGGQWRYVMTANGGFEVAFHGEFREIDVPTRLVNTEAFEGVPDPDGTAGLVTVTLTEKDGRTYLEALCDYHEKTIRDMVIDSGMESGMQQSYDALEEVAASL